MRKPKPAPQPVPQKPAPIILDVTEGVRDWLNQPVIDILKRLEKTMSELDDAVAAVGKSVDTLQTSTDKATTDIQTSIKDLIAKITTGGVDPTAAIAALKGISAKVDALNSGIQALDVAAVAADPNTVPPVPPVA